MKLGELFRALPKAELHIHVEGALEASLLRKIARRNSIEASNAEQGRVAPPARFRNLSDFLEAYYRGVSVLQKTEDFYDLLSAYLRRAEEDGVAHAEISFDPQAHLSRGVAFDAIIEGLSAAQQHWEQSTGRSSLLIMCILRDRPVEEAEALLDMVTPHADKIVGIGLDSAEHGFPPAPFKKVFDRGRALGWRPCIHAGEEGPPEYVWQAIRDLKAERIGHGVRALEDPALVDELRARGTAISACPLSNLALRVVSDPRNHPLREMIDLGLDVSVNSDDPAYFGGYVVDNFSRLIEPISLTEADAIYLARKSIETSFAPEARKKILLEELERVGGK